MVRRRILEETKTSELCRPVSVVPEDDSTMLLSERLGYQ